MFAASRAVLPWKRMPRGRLTWTFALPVRRSCGHSRYSKSKSWPYMKPRRCSCGPSAAVRAACKCIHGFAVTRAVGIVCCRLTLRRRARCCIPRPSGHGHGHGPPATDTATRSHPATRPSDHVHGHPATGAPIQPRPRPRPSGHGHSHPVTATATAGRGHGLPATATAIRPRTGHPATDTATATHQKNNPSSCCTVSLPVRCLWVPFRSAVCGCHRCLSIGVFAGPRLSFVFACGRAFVPLRSDSYLYLLTFGVVSSGALRPHPVRSDLNKRDHTRPKNHETTKPKTHKTNDPKFPLVTGCRNWAAKHHNGATCSVCGPQVVLTA